MKLFSYFSEKKKNRVKNLEYLSSNSVLCDPAAIKSLDTWLTELVKTKGASWNKNDGNLQLMYLINRFKFTPEYIEHERSVIQAEIIKEGCKYIIGLDGHSDYAEDNDSLVWINALGKVVCAKNI